MALKSQINWTRIHHDHCINEETKIMKRDSFFDGRESTGMKFLFFDAWKAVILNLREVHLILRCIENWIEVDRIIAIMIQEKNMNDNAIQQRIFKGWQLILLQIADVSTFHKDWQRPQGIPFAGSCATLGCYRL